jgi:hypothetical protein
MGTSGAYTGSGGKPGKDLRRGVDDWLAQLASGDQVPTSSAGTSGNGDHPKVPDDDADRLATDAVETQPDATPNRLPTEALLNVIALLRPRRAGGGHGDGPGGVASGGRPSVVTGGRSRGGPQRSVAGFAGPAGRAASAAYAYRTGDAPGLAVLGLDYGELRALGNPLEVVRRIVDAACGPMRSTIEDAEERYVAAGITDWVVAQAETPSPEEIARKTIALIIEEVALDETGDAVRRNEFTNAGELTEQEIADIAEVVAERAELSINGVTDAEFAQAIEEGIETLRRIRGGRPR